MGKKLELAVGILNGAVGDYLARSDNGLATPMECFHHGVALPMERQALAKAHPDGAPRVALLVHGLMCTEDVWQFPDGSDYGSRLAQDAGVTPLYLRYNSGLAIADSGKRLAELLAALLDAYPRPIEELLLIGYSMGGLVIRSACHVAAVDGMAWLSRVQRVIYVGTPHLGAPMERVGRVLARLLHAVPDPYTRLIAQIAELRSDGVKDLGDADLRHEDRARRLCQLSLRDPRHPVPLLDSMRHYLVAGSLHLDPRLASLFGDAVVPVPSATDGGCIDAASIALPPDHVKLLAGLDHVTLAHHPDVYAQIRAWCEATA